MWPTTSKVVRYEPGKAVAWKTRESGATWTYELAPTTSGTTLLRASQPTFTFEGLATSRISKVGITPIPIP